MTSQKPTVSELIREFELAKTPTKPMPKTYEIYIAMDNAIYGHNIDWLSDKQIIERYDKVWRFNRDGERFTVATNSELIMVDHARHFVVSIYNGAIRTISIDLFNMTSETK